MLKREEETASSLQKSIANNSIVSIHAYRKMRHAKATVTRYLSIFDAAIHSGGQPRPPGTTIFSSPVVSRHDVGFHKPWPVDTGPIVKRTSFATLSLYLHWRGVGLGTIAQE